MTIDTFIVTRRLVYPMYQVRALLLPAMLGLMIAACTGGGDRGSVTVPPPPSPPPPPVADRFEPNNDTGQAVAVVLPVNETGLTIHDGTDEDFFQFDLAVPSDVQVTVRFVHSAGDIDAELLDDNGGQISLGDSSTDDEELTEFGLVAGMYFVRVFGSGGATTEDYAISVQTVATPHPSQDELFGDILIYRLANASVFGSGVQQTLALESDMLNVGTAPAPGSNLGNGTAEFGLLDLNGVVIVRGTKGPVFFTDNGGCNARPDIYDDWVARGMPHIDGTAGHVSLTSPGCIDFYTARTNNDLDTPLQIGDPAVVPDGDYFYEMQFDATDIYTYEPDFARANNSSAVPITISSNGSQRSVVITGPIMRSGTVTLDSGTMTTRIGSGAGLGVLPVTFNNDNGIERPSGVARNAAGEFFFTLRDDGSLCRDNGDGTSTKIIEGLNLPMVFDFFDNDDVVIADFANDRILFATAASNYSDGQALTFSGFAINSPTAARVGPDGLIYVSNSGNHEVLMLDPISTVARRVAGTGVQGFSGDGEAANAAQLSYPIDIDVTAEGLLIIADGHNNRLRIVNLSSSDVLSIGGMKLLPGQIKTLAGAGSTSLSATIFDNGTNGYRGDRQHARAVMLDWPVAPRVVNGQVFFIDADNHRLRLIDEFGIIHTLAGNTPLPGGNGQISLGSEIVNVGDGNSGLNATLNWSTDINVTAQPLAGIVIEVGDTNNYRIREQSNITLTVLPYFGQ